MLAIVGPTASGKSRLSMQIAEAVGAEILSCDSVQVYRSFQIGCAKPSAAERARVPHHGIDVVDWSDEFDARKFRELARRAIADAKQRQVPLILCGGTGLYLRLLRWGLAESPEADLALRKRLSAQEAQSPGALYAKLLEVDPDSAASIEPLNLVHVIRALEICELSGEPASAIRRRHGFRHEEVPMRVVVLQAPRDTLRAKIRERAGHMLDHGLLQEVQALLTVGVAEDCRPMGSVGYRECVDVLRGRTSADTLLDAIAQNTWRYARRQMTWFRKEREVESHLLDDAESLTGLGDALAHDVEVWGI